MEDLLLLVLVLLVVLLLLGIVALSIYILLLFVDVSLEISELFCDFFERRKEKKRAALKGRRVSEKEFSHDPNTIKEEEDKDE